MVLELEGTHTMGQRVDPGHQGKKTEVLRVEKNVTKKKNKWGVKGDI